MEANKQQLFIFSGLKHSGKSSVARLIAQRFNVHSQDLDVLIARLAVQEKPELASSGDHAAIVRNLYRNYGKEAFQDFEARAAGLAVSVASPAPLEQIRIISLGGGTMENAVAMSSLIAKGFNIFLDAPCDLLFDRIMRGGLPAFLDPLDPKKSFEQLYERRRALGIAQAHQVLAIGTMNLEQACAELVPIIKEHLNVR